MQKSAHHTDSIVALSGTAAQQNVAVGLTLWFLFSGGKSKCTQPEIKIRATNIPFLYFFFLNFSVTFWSRIFILFPLLM